MVGTQTSGEEAQLAQTIEMFEAITQSQPQDYQSLEILKEAYTKLGREEDARRTSKRIAQAHVMMGQLSSAILEYEGLLQRYPDDEEVKAALAEIQNRAGGLHEEPAAPEVKPAAPSPAPEDLPLPFPIPGQSDQAESATSDTEIRVVPTDFDDGRDGMYSIFVESKTINQQIFEECWTPPDWSKPPDKPVDPFIQVLADKSIVPIEKSLRLLSDKCRMGFIPLDRYDVDVELTRQFAAETCRRWCVLPFDRLSKSILVATANPFNTQAVAELERVTRERLLFYLAAPMDIMNILKKVFR